ncbi:MAG: hypothetical protein ACI3Z0_02425 [Candidatus Cryptobacteroides sp.]
MYKEYKVVVNTAAGRRRYMQYLIPYIVSCPIVDRYDIWINTHNGADIEFFKQVATKFPVVNLVWQPDGIVNGNASINAFYKACVESDTIYFKLDDDIVWMEPGLIEKMVAFRVENPQYFVVSPLVINNSLSTYLLQISGKIKLDQYYSSASAHPILWKNGNFACELHHWFIDKYLKTEKWSVLHLGKKEMGMTRFSINAILWFGDEMKKFGGVVPGDDEEFMSCIYPTGQGLSNAWNGDAVVAHFAFFTQRQALDRMGILEKYGDLCLRMWARDPEMKSISDKVQQVMTDIQQNQLELENRPSPYKYGAKRKVPYSTIKKIIPDFVLEVLRQRREEKRQAGFIL